jgi:carboxylate-amine ligase
MAIELKQRLDSARTPRWTDSTALEVDGLRALFEERSGPTIGLEEELMLLVPKTMALSTSAERVFELLDGEDHYAAELRPGQIEIQTPVCGNAVAASLCLADGILRLRDRLAGSFVVAASGTHPFSPDRGGSGLHVHVAVSGADRALAVYNAARSFLPEFTALAANSPFVEGEDTGLVSARGRSTQAPDRAGVPPALSSWEEYVRLVESGPQGGVSPDMSRRSWGLRPHPVFGTLELRSCDSQTRVEDAAAVAAIFQCLVVWLAERYDERGELAVHETSRIAENVWRASRYGTRATMVDPETGAQEETRSRIQRLLQALEPTASRHGTTGALLTASTLLADNGADRQRYLAAEYGLDGLVRWLADETVLSAQDYLERRP